jgi:RNA polymerase sigma factor (sigma-70 family)
MRYKDDQLLHQASYGELYAEMYRRYAPALFAYVYRHLSSREDAEDIVLDVFLSVLQDCRFPSFDQQKQEAWLWTITRNKTVDHLRRSTRRPQVSLEWFSELFDDGIDPEQINLEREEYALVASAVRNLPEIQQEVLRLRFGHGLSSDEIGRVVDKSGSAVRMLLSRTLRFLRTFCVNQAESGQK